jgi:acetyl esterase
VVAFYPPTNMSIAPADKVPPGGSPLAVPPLLRTIMSAFRAAYLPPGVDPADPRISVVNAESHGFPEKVLILTAGEDRLAPEAESLGEKLKGAGKELVVKRFEGMRHGWDKAAEEGSEDARVRDEAYNLVVKFLEDIRQR